MSTSGSDTQSREFELPMGTIASVERRLQALSQSVSRISTLLATRVDVAREEQNQMLLTSLNRRAEVQLHLMGDAARPSPDFRVPTNTEQRQRVGL